jgi:hypothetical protein
MRPPLAVRKLSHGFEGVVVVSSVLFLHERSGDALGLRGAQVGRFEDRAQGPLGGHRVLADELLAAGYHAAEVLRPDAAVVRKWRELKTNP